MKIIAIILTLVLISISGCQPGETTLKLTGEETALPAELKGLRVYTVNVGTLDQMKIAVLNGNVVGTSYSMGKTTVQNGQVYVNNAQNTATETGGSVSGVLNGVIYEDDNFIIIKKK